MFRRVNFSTSVVLLLLYVSNNNMYAAPDSEVKLVLLITVDGLRGDLLNRYQRNFGKGGFRYLLDKGVVYTNAHYQHANTETIVGHTTLATGTYPSIHGMVGNVWYDRDAGELAYNIEDPQHPLLPSRETQLKGAQVDPSQKQSRTQGRSPTAILAATVSDGLAAYSGGHAKVYAVGGKDRSAVSMAGHVGKAFWYSTDSGDFVTSSYYFDSYPEWVKDWNALRKAESHAGSEWTLLNDKSTYLLGQQDDRPYEADLNGYGRVFPHPFGGKDNKLLYTLLVASPVGDQLAVDFSKALISNEHLGQDAIPDYLSISLSSVDVVNHFFGPSSLENEDTVLQLDRTLADLFQFIDNAVGLKHTLIVLSADHGMADMPEYLTELGYKAGRLTSEEIVKIANDTAKKRLGINNAVKFFFRPYVYLDPEKIAASKHSQAKVETTIANALTRQEGIALVVPRSQSSTATENPVVQQVERNFHPIRSGDIYVVQKPYWFMFEKGPIVTMHGSPWRYDTHVPIIFAGMKIKPKTIHRLVHPVDVAPTITTILGMSPPSAAQGIPLREVLTN